MKLYTLILIFLLSGCFTTNNNFTGLLEVCDSDFSIKKIAAFNNTGTSFEGINVVDEMRSTVIKAAQDGDLYHPGGEGSQFNVSIMEYVKGNAFKRWLLPGYGSTYLKVGGILVNSDGQIIANSYSERLVHTGGGYTIRAWKRVFGHVARDLISEIKRSRNSKRCRLVTPLPDKLASTRFDEMN